MYGPTQCKVAWVLTHTSIGHMDGSDWSHEWLGWLAQIVAMDLNGFFPFLGMGLPHAKPTSVVEIKNDVVEIKNDVVRSAAF